MNPTAADRLDIWACRGFFAAALVVHLFCSFAGWRNPPVDGHEFRQAQTAIAIRYLIQDGLTIDYPTPVLGPPWSVPLEFPLYQLSAAAAARVTGLELEPAARATAAAYFYLMLPAVYLLAGRLGLRAHRRLLLLAAVLLSPIYLFYQRAIMIESTALCLGAWYLWWHWRAVDTRDGRSIAAAVAAGGLAAMVKLPTFCAFLAPAALVTLLGRPAGHRGSGPDLGRWGPALAGAGGALAAGLAWSAYADRLKALNPLAQDLQSRAQGAWAVGEWSLRTLPRFWAAIGHFTTSSVIGLAALAIVALAAAVGPPARRRQILLLALSFLAPVLVFANVYHVHDYYFFANGIFLLAALGLAFDVLLDHPRVPRLAAFAAVALTAGLALAGYRDGYHRLIAGNEHRVPELGRALAAVTAADDVLVIFGDDWKPVLPYVARRRALMFPQPREDDRVAQQAAYERLRGLTVGALVVTDASRHRADLLRPAIERFRLGPEPVLSGDTTDVYLPADRAPAAAARLAGLGLHRHRVAGHAAVATRQPADPGRFPMMRPAPREVAALYGVTMYQLGDREVLGAHPDCDLVFSLPADATRVRAGFGLLAAAAENPDKHSDGVTFAVVLVPRAGPARVLAERTLTPFANPADRGEHAFDVPLPAGAAGDLILRTGAGPAGSLAYDWAFWSFARIE